ncbi:hypothetical protein M1N85_04795, partial [Dehalococcoidia bacterium]|nr:hypothetical protein [Dehalococcoidia bacterium]
RRFRRLNALQPSLTLRHGISIIPVPHKGAKPLQESWARPLLRGFQGESPPRDLASLFKDTGGDKEKQNVNIHEAIRRYGYTLNQVEAVVGLH